MTPDFPHNWHWKRKLKIDLILVHSNCFTKKCFCIFTYHPLEVTQYQKKSKKWWIILPLMCFSHKHTELIRSAKMKIYILSRAKLLCSLYHEIPCNLVLSAWFLFALFLMHSFFRILYRSDTNGQLILECLFSAFDSHKKQTWKFEFLP